jgi:hypothetical protein
MGYVPAAAEAAQDKAKDEGKGFQSKARVTNRVPCILEDVLYRTRVDEDKNVIGESFGKEVKPCQNQARPPSLYTGKSHIKTNMHVHQVIVLEDSYIKYQDQFDHMSTALSITHHMTYIYPERKVSV